MWRRTGNVSKKESFDEAAADPCCRRRSNQPVSTVGLTSWESSKRTRALDTTSLEGTGTMSSDPAAAPGPVISVPSKRAVRNSHMHVVVPVFVLSLCLCCFPASYIVISFSPSLPYPLSPSLFQGTQRLSPKGLRAQGRAQQLADWLVGHARMDHFAYSSVLWSHVNGKVGARSCCGDGCLTDFPS